MRSALLALLLAAGAAQADEVVLHVYSWHSAPITTNITTNYVNENGQTVYTLTTTTTEELNNANVGLGYRWRNGWNVGAYYNSYREPSVYIAKDWMFTDYLGVLLGVASGYQAISNNSWVTSYGVAPLAAVVLRKKLTDDVVLGIQLVPPMGEGTAGVVHFTLSYVLQR